MCLKKIDKIIALLANLTVISGIFFAVYQIIESKQLEKRSIAIEAINSTRSNDFIKAYNKLLHEDITADDLNYVIGVYDTIANLYTNDLADQCIIKENLYLTAKDILRILDNDNNISKIYKENIFTFVALMDKKYCQ